VGRGQRSLPLSLDTEPAGLSHLGSLGNPRVMTARFQIGCRFHRSSAQFLLRTRTVSLKQGGRFRCAHMTIGSTALKIHRDILLAGENSRNLADISVGSLKLLEI